MIGRISINTFNNPNFDISKLAGGNSFSSNAPASPPSMFGPPPTTGFGIPMNVN